MNTKEEENLEENTSSEEENLEEDNDVINDIMKIFDNPEYAYPLEDVIEELEGLGHHNPGTIITCAIQDELLYVDNVEDDGTVYLALVDQVEEE